MVLRPEGDPVPLGGPIRALRISPDGRRVGAAVATHYVVVADGAVADRGPLSSDGALLEVEAASVVVIEDGYAIRRGPGDPRGKYLAEATHGATRDAGLTADQAWLIVVMEDMGEPPLAVVCDLAGVEGHALVPPERGDVEGTLNAFVPEDHEGRVVGLFHFLDDAGATAACVARWSVADGVMACEQPLDPAALAFPDPSAYVGRGLASFGDQLLAGPLAVGPDGEARALGLTDVRDVAVLGDRAIVATAAELVVLDRALAVVGRVSHGASAPTALAAADGRVALADGATVRTYAFAGA